MTPLFYIAVGLYGLASVFYLVFLYGRTDRILSLARWSLTAALAAHLAMIGVLCTEKLNPIRDIRGALSLSGFLLGLGFWSTTIRTRMGALGALIAPSAMMLLISARLTPQHLSVDDTTTSILGRVHIALSALGVAAFGLAAAVAVIYLFQEAAIKNKRIGSLFRRSPPLATLDNVGQRLILIGFPIYSLAVIIGFVWFSQLHASADLRLEHIIAALTWLIFGLLIMTRLTVGWRGRRAAWMTLIGFTALIAVLLIYMSRRMLDG